MFAAELMWGPATPFGLTSAKLATIVAALTLICLTLAVVAPEIARRGEPGSRRRWWAHIAPVMLIMGQLLTCALVFLLVNRVGWFYSSFADLFG
ncbi:hypothetical protein BSZ39_06985 [Bowdeniella nasicola]|uniref:Uncharacterized protein n=1 Tax=Bowdeniella nasicola TaxID=208480 RepID=A0A1Q5Q203_9ACTO|nr:hypothetical protein [Bowdeniella nasicola]OKL53884.1 hypothetical protein BSZ39_06985 [Bowdeniella nasicola]